MRLVPRLRLLAALLLLTAAPAAAQNASVSVVHNAIDPGVRVLDGWILDLVQVVDNIAFREATKYAAGIPANLPLEIDITLGADNSPAKPLFTKTLTFAPGQSYQVVAAGELGVAGETAFDLIPLVSRQAAEAPGQVEVRWFHGVTDGGAVDIAVSGAGLAADNLAFGKATAYQALAPGVYDVTVTSADAAFVFGRFRLDLTAAAGEALLLMTTGTVRQVPEWSNFDVLLVRADGATKLLDRLGGVATEEDAVLPERFAVHAAYPNPFNPTTQLSFDMPQAGQVYAEVYDPLGRLMLRTAPTAAAAGRAQTLALDASGLPSGAYVYRIVARTAGRAFTGSGRFVLLK